VKKGEENISEYEREEELRREEKTKKWILMFFTCGEKEEEERRRVCCEIRDYRLFIGAFYRQFYRRIIKY
jgi:hypothetical protein